MPQAGGDSEPGMGLLARRGAAEVSWPSVMSRLSCPHDLVVVLRMKQTPSIQLDLIPGIIIIIIIIHSTTFPPPPPPTGPPRRSCSSSTSRT
jgi:hypothetical protein